MIRYIFVAAFVYIVFRVVQVILRMLSPGARNREGSGDSHAPAGPRPSGKYEDIRDADFEDLPPGKEVKKEEGDGAKSA